MKTRWIVALATTTALGGCTCRARHYVLLRDDDATPIRDASAPPPDKQRFEIIGADIVDLAQPKVVVTLKERPTRFAVDAGGAYVWNRARLDAIDLPSGHVRWSYEDHSPEPVQAPILVDDRNVYVAWDDRAFAFDRATGARSDLVHAVGTNFIADAAIFDGAYVAKLYGAAATFVDLGDRSVHTEMVPMGALTVVLTKEIVLGFSMDMSATALGVRAWSPKGKVLFDRRFDAASASGPPAGFTAEIPGYFLLSGRDPGPRSVVVSMRDGAVAFDTTRPIAGATVDAAGALEWILAPSKASSIDALDPKTGTARWNVPLPCVNDTIAVASLDRTLFLAGYTHASGSGCLVAVDRDSGAVRWQQQLDDARVPHSEYWNEVSLRTRGDALVVVGREAGAEYVELIDGKSGDVRFDHLVRF